MIAILVKISNRCQDNGFLEMNEIDQNRNFATNMKKIEIVTEAQLSQKYEVG